MKILYENQLHQRMMNMVQAVSAMIGWMMVKSKRPISISETSVK